MGLDWHRHPNPHLNQEVSDSEDDAQVYWQKDFLESGEDDEGFEHNEGTHRRRRHPFPLRRSNPPSLQYEIYRPDIATIGRPPPAREHIRDSHAKPSPMVADSAINTPTSVRTSLPLPPPAPLSYSDPTPDPALESIEPRPESASASAFSDDTTSLPRAPPGAICSLPSNPSPSPPQTTSTESGPTQIQSLSPMKAAKQFHLISANPPLPPAQTELPLPPPLSSRDTDSAIDTPLPVRSDTRIAAGSDFIRLDSNSSSQCDITLQFRSSFASANQQSSNAGKKTAIPLISPPTLYKYASSPATPCFRHSPRCAKGILTEEKLEQFLADVNEEYPPNMQMTSSESFENQEDSMVGPSKSIAKLIEVYADTTLKNIGNGIGNDFAAGVQMPGLNYTEMVDPTQCSEVARCNVADDYGKLGVVILSPHGHFTQANVLGYPNTGGQVAYILDQARVLENEMLLRIKQKGLDITPRILIVTRLLPDAVGTTCGQHLQKAIGTEHPDYCQILRVPLQTENRIIQKWISRFEVWPYLETYADDVANELAREFQATPDLIIGNFSDGNLVASLLAHKLGVTQYTITHALKKIKYPNSDIYWKNLLSAFKIFDPGGLLLIPTIPSMTSLERSRALLTQRENDAEHFSYSLP